MDEHFGSTGLTTVSGAFPVFFTANVYTSCQPSALPRTGLSAASLVVEISEAWLKSL